SRGAGCRCCGGTRPAEGAWGDGNDVIAATMPPGAHDCGNHVVARVTADGSGGNGEEGGAGVPGEVLTLSPAVGSEAAEVPPHCPHADVRARRAARATRAARAARAPRSRGQ